MIFKDYYKILGLENSRVTLSEIKSAYREQAKLYHPDVNVGDKTSEERFKDINEAYRVLSTGSSKRKYDRMWNNHAQKNKAIYEESKREKGSTFSDFFNMFFGEANDELIEDEVKNKKVRKNAPINGENIETAIDVSIEDAFFGVTKKISLRTIEGKMRTFDVKIPAGIRTGEKIRLLGQGKQGKNGGKDGDLLIGVNIKNDSRFKIKGYDIHTDLFLTPWEAALGTRTNIIGIDDEANVYIQEGIQSGDSLTIPGRGYKDAKGGRGNLIADIKVMVPKELTQEEKEAFLRLKEISEFNPRKEKVNIKNI